jgi:hypothetical protein
MFLFLIYFYNNGISESKEKINYQISLDTISVFDLTNSGQYIFGYTLNVGIIKSTDLGENWVTSNLGIKENDNLLFVKANNNYCITWHPYNYNFYISKDTGNNWSKDNFFLDRKYNINDVCFFENKVIVSTYSGIYYKDLLSNSWDSLKYFENIECGEIISLNETIYFSTKYGLMFGNLYKDIWCKIINPPFKKDIFIYSMVLANNKLIISNDSGIFISNNNGIDWKDITSNIQIPKDDYEGIIKLFNFNRIIYISKKEGIFYFNDSLNVWLKCFVQEIPNSFYSNWCVTLLKNIIFIGSQSVGIFKSTDGLIFYPLIRDISKIKYN